MSMEYIRKTYGVPAKRGGRVNYMFKEIMGTITGSRGGHLLIKLDGHKRSLPFHPVWQIAYLDQDKDQKT
jgi:hypothetical protein